MLKEYADLLADVRYDGRHHSVRSLVQPDDPLVQETANVLIQSGDFIANCQDFVNAFTTYRLELGDYWAIPQETMSPRCPICIGEVDALPSTGGPEEEQLYRCSFCGWQGKEIRVGDCDDKAILLCSLLRNYLPPDQVFCAVGLWDIHGKPDGHMWVVGVDKNGNDRIIESTAPASQVKQGTYILSALFNDRYAFATPLGIKEFDLIPVLLATGGAKERLKAASIFR